MERAAQLTLAKPDMLALEVFSIADLAVEDRLPRLWRAFDAHPALRPLRVGPGDPPRIKVAGSLEAAMQRYDLPFEWWFTVRRSKPVWEGGSLKLYPGRGGFVRTARGEGRWLPHEVSLSWEADWIRENRAEEDVAELFADLCEALGAAWGMVYQVHQAGQWMAFVNRSRRGPGDLERELRDVFWLNWFGAPFVDRFPALSSMPGATRRPGGGVLVRTTPGPWTFEPAAQAPDYYVWKRPLYAVLGREAFAPHGAAGRLPTLREHMANTGGTQELPEERWERERAARSAAKDEQRRARRFEKARQALAATSAGEAPRPGRIEFSASFDADELKAFWRRLGRRFRGDLATARGRALLALILSSPLDWGEEREMMVEGPEGPELVGISWFMDDVDAPDLAIHGSAALTSELARMAGPE